MIRSAQKTVLIEISPVCIEEKELAEGLRDDARRKRRKLSNKPAEKNIKSLLYPIHSDDAIGRIMDGLERLNGFGMHTIRHGNELQVTASLISLRGAKRKVKRVVRKTKDVQSTGRRSPFAYLRQYQTAGAHRAA